MIAREQIRAAMSIDCRRLAAAEAFGMSSRTAVDLWADDMGLNREDRGYARRLYGGLRREAVAMYGGTRIRIDLEAPAPSDDTAALLLGETRPLGSEGRVYFISHDGRFAKVGTARDFLSRMKGYRSSAPGVPFRVLACTYRGGSIVEKQIHSVLAPARIVGEWFARRAVDLLIAEWSAALPDAFDADAVVPANAMFAERLRDPEAEWLADALVEMRRARAGEET